MTPKEQLESLIDKVFNDNTVNPIQLSEDEVFITYWLGKIDKELLEADIQLARKSQEIKKTKDVETDTQWKNNIKMLDEYKQFKELECLSKQGSRLVTSIRSRLRTLEKFGI